MKTCATCGKAKEDRHYRKDGRYKDNLSPICNACRGSKQASDAETVGRILAETDQADRWQLISRVFGALPTVDIPRIPILAEGGPYFGTGSPPEGDFFSKADLELIAEQTNLLMGAGELRPPNKLGHSEEQRLLNNSGLPVGDELPAAGWLTNFAVEKISGIWKLVADAKNVPAKLAQIFESGGYRTRSVELSRVTSQKASPGTSYDGVVTGLAWLGAKAPAVRTLDDVWNLYAGTEPAKAATKLAVGDVVWEEEDGVMDLISDLTEAINEAANPDQPSYMWPYWVSDVNLKLNQCVVEEYGGADASWIVGFTVDKTTNEPAVQPRDQWVPATMKLVEIDPATLDDDDQEALGLPVAVDDDEYAGREFAVTDKAWDGSASRYDDTDAYCKACLIDENDSGADKVQSKCKLPVYEPNGDLNSNAVRDAISRLPQLKGVSQESKDAAKKKLRTLAKECGIDTDLSAVETYVLMRQQARAHFRRTTADTNREMKLTDKQIASLAKTFAIDGEGDELRSKVEAHLRETLGVEEQKTEVKPDPVETPIALSSFSEEQRAELAPLLKTLTERAERGDRAYAQHFAEVREGKLLRAMNEGRLNPADRDQWVAFYNANPELASKQLEALPVNPILLLTLGSDEENLEIEAGGASADAYLVATGAAMPGDAAPTKSGGDA